MKITTYQVILTHGARVCVLAAFATQAEAAAALERERAWAAREQMSGTVSVRPVEVN
jgi:hypothetical protein